MKPLHTLCAAAMALALSAPGLADDSRSTAVGSDGTVYVARTGLYGALFAGVPANRSSAPVLALDVTSADGTSSRILVPGTDDANLEDSAVVLLQEPTGDLYILWSSRNGAAASLLLRSYARGKFSNGVVLDDNPQAQKTAPQIGITRDSYTTTDARGTTRAVQRTVLHLLWWESDSARGSAMYRSVLFVNGDLVGADSLIDLGDLDAATVEPDAAKVTASLIQSPMLAPGRNEHAAIMAFVNPRTGRLLTFEAAVVPGELSALADDLREYMVGTAEQTGLDDIVKIADLVRVHLIGGGRRFSDGVLLALGEEIRAHLIGGGRSGIDAVGLAEDSRRFLLRAGADLLANGLDSPELPPNSSAIIELPVDDAGATHQLQLRIMGRHRAPVTAESANRIYTSPDGARLLVAWDAPSTLRYSELRGEEWSAPLGIKLGPALSLDAAASALARRVREH